MVACCVPNTEIINKTVASYTNFPHLRIDVGVTAGVNEDLDNVRRLLLSLVTDDAALMAEPAPRVVATALNDYSVAMEPQAWEKTKKDFADTERAVGSTRQTTEGVWPVAGQARSGRARSGHGPLYLSRHYQVPLVFPLHTLRHRRAV